jgi:hypothetical protein
MALFNRRKKNETEPVSPVLNLTQNPSISKKLGPNDEVFETLFLPLADKNV